MAEEMEIVTPDDLPKDTLKIGNRMGFIETIDDTLKVYRSIVDDNDNDQVPFEEKMAVRDAIEHIKHCDLYHMGEEFNEILTDWGDQFHDILFGEMRFSKFTRPPSRLCYVRVAQVERYLGEQDIQNLGFLIEYFEDGKYHYSNFKEDGKAVDGKARSVKFEINKWLKSAYTKKYLEIILEYLFEVDEDIPKKQSEKISELKKQLKDITNKNEKELNDKVIQESELRLESFRDEYRERIEKQTLRIQDLIHKNNIMEQTLLQQREAMNLLRKEKNDNQIDLEIQIKKAKKKYKKKKKKKKKKYDSSDSSDSDYEYDNNSGGD